MSKEQHLRQEQLFIQVIAVEVLDRTWTFVYGMSKVVSM